MPRVKIKLSHTAQCGSIGTSAQLEGHTSPKRPHEGEPEMISKGISPSSQGRAGTPRPGRRSSVGPLRSTDPSVLGAPQGSQAEKEMITFVSLLSWTIVNTLNHPFTRLHGLTVMLARESPTELRTVTPQRTSRPSRVPMQPRPGRLVGVFL